MATVNRVFRLHLRWVLPLLCLAIALPALAANNADQTHIGHTMRVGPNDHLGEVTCIGCSIYIRGQVNGDATAVGGSIYLEDQGQVAGDVTTVAGNLRLDSSTKVGGDATVVAGELRRANGAQIGGDVTSVGGIVWVPIILLSPFVFLGLLVWLIVYLVQRGRKPALPAAA
jgi:hypothetical protein